MESTNSGLRKASKDSIIYLIGNLINGINGLVMGKLYTNIFTTAEIGDYSIIISTLSLMISILIGWLDNSVVRFANSYAKNDNEDEFDSTVFVSLTVVNLAAFLIGFLVLNLFKRYIVNYNLFLLAIVLFIPQSYNTILMSTLRIKQKSFLYSLNNVIISIGRIVIVYVLFTVFKIRIESIIYAFIISYLITIAINVRHLKIFKHIALKKWTYNIFKEIIHYGMPLIGLAFSSWILSLSDRYIIRVIGNSSQVGIYSNCYNISSFLFNMINTFMMLAAYPIILKVWDSKGKEETQKIIGTFLKYYFFITIPCFFGVLGIGKNLIEVLSTKEYASGSFTFYMVSLGIILLGVSDYTNKVWELTKNTKIIFKLNVLVAIINVALNIILIPVFGYQIAALTTAVCYLIYLLISTLRSRKIFRISVNLKSLLKTILASFIMFLVIKTIDIFIKNTYIMIIISVIVGVIVYVFIMYFLKEINNEVNYIIGKLRKN